MDASPTLKFCCDCKHAVLERGTVQCGHNVNHVRSLVSGEWIFKYPADYLREHARHCGTTGQLWEPRLEVA